MREWAIRLADGPPIALATTKALLNGAETLTLAQAIDREYLAQKCNANTKDFREGRSAFTEKREPVFSGR